MADLNQLISLIGETQVHFKQQAQKQVNTALTLRNWLFGFYIAEYELNGTDRAKYGQKIYKEIAQRLAMRGFQQIRERHLYLCKDFYFAYPNILRSATAKFIEGDFPLEYRTENSPVANNTSSEITDKLINQLSFTHIIELLKADTLIKRNFYETEAIKNCWSVRELQRAMNSMLFERTGLSTDKQKVLTKHNQQGGLLPEDLFRNPYILEFLGLKEENEYSESDLEEAIITHLQTFLLELGRGFCFEAWQKRITFDNTHYRIDLKLGEFTHADAGQMNVYLNYYKENETNEGDNPPIGIILCAGKNESLVKYSTAGLPQQVFVNKYMINLPKEEELQRIIDEEQKKLNMLNNN